MLYNIHRSTADTLWINYRNQHNFSYERYSCKIFWKHSYKFIFISNIFIEIYVYAIQKKRFDSSETLFIIINCT